MRRGAVVLVVLGALGAVALFAWARSLGVPSYACAVLACGALVCPALPAALLLWAGRGGRDPYGYEVNRPDEQAPTAQH